MRLKSFSVLFLSAFLGCAGPLPIFPPVEPPILWPSAGDPPRFAYVGKFEGEADLKRRPSFWERIKGFFAGPPPPASLLSPYAAAVSGSRALHVSDPDLHLVHRFDLRTREYRALTQAGIGRPFDCPIGLAMARERLVVADRGLKAVAVLSPAGEPALILGEGYLEGPVGVAVGPRTGRIYVADVPAHKIVAFDLAGKKVLAFGKRGRGTGEFNFPTHVACDGEENIYVSDSLNFRVQVFDRKGQFLNGWGKKGDFPGDFSQPKGIAVDRGGRVYVVDSQFENIQVFDREGRLLLSIGEEGTGLGQFWLPVGISIDNRGEIWVGDLYNRRVQVFRYLGDPSPEVKS